MIYVQSYNGIFIRRIEGSINYQFSDTVNQPADTLGIDQQAAFGLSPLALTPRPTFDASVSQCVDQDTQLMGGNWTQVWSVVPLTKSQLCDKADLMLAAALDAGIPLNGTTYHCDGVFQTQIQAFLLAFQSGIIPPGGTVPIRTMDNSIIQMTQSQLTSFAGALLQHVQSLYQTNWAVHDAS